MNGVWVASSVHPEGHNESKRSQYPLDCSCWRRRGCWISGSWFCDHYGGCYSDSRGCSCRRCCGVVVVRVVVVVVVVVVVGWLHHFCTCSSIVTCRCRNTALKYCSLRALRPHLAKIRMGFITWIGPCLSVLTFSVEKRASAEFMCFWADQSGLILNPPLARSPSFRVWYFPREVKVHRKADDGGRRFVTAY